MVEAISLLEILFQGIDVHSSCSELQLAINTIKLNFLQCTRKQTTKPADPISLQQNRSCAWPGIVVFTRAVIFECYLRCELKNII